MNHYACYALKSENGNYAWTDAVLDCSFGGGVDFSFGMDLYWDRHSGIIFSQNDSVCCEAKEGYVIWKTPEFTLASSSLTLPLMEGTWNHVDVIYRQNFATLYINGILADQKSINMQKKVSEEPFHYLESYNGYLRNVRLIDFAMTDEQIQSNLFTMNIDQTHLWLWIPFDEPIPKDAGKYQKVIHCEGLCRVESMVKALVFSGKGYARIDDTTINPGAQGLESFTIALRILVQPCASDKSILLENAGESDCFQVYLCENQTKLGILVGEESCIFHLKEIPVYEWTDMVIAVSETKVVAWINGQTTGEMTLSSPYARTDSPNIRIGENYTGGLDYLAIYNKCLNGEEINAIHQYEPYVFDDGIQMLFLLHGESDDDMVSSGSILLKSGVEFQIMEGTVFEKTIEPLQIRTGGTFTGDVFEKWQADLLTEVCVNYIAVLVGVETTAITVSDGVKQYLWNAVQTSDEAQKLLIDYEDFSGQEIVDLMSNTCKNKVLTNVITSIVIGGSMTGATLVNAEKLSEFFFFMIGATLIAKFAFDIAKKVKEKTKDPQKPPIPPCPPIPHKGYNITLISIQFQNDEKGSLPLRSNYDQPQQLPEWSREDGKSGICAYLSGSNQKMVKIQFKYQHAQDQPPVKIRIGWESTYLGSCLSDEVLCTISQTYETTAICSKMNLQNVGMGMLTDKLRCFYTEGIHPKMLPVAAMDIHVLCKTPLEPFSIANSKQAPLIPLLKVASHIAQNQKSIVSEETSFLNAATLWLSSKKTYQLSESETYSNAKLQGTEFCMKSFLEALETQKLNCGRLDYMVFIASLAAMEGLKIKIYEICCGENATLTMNRKLRIEWSGIDVNECRIFDKEVPLHARRYYLLKPGIQNKEHYWDPLLVSKTGTLFCDQTWEEYRKIAIRKSSYVEEPVPMKDWQIVETSPIPKLTIVYSGELHQFVKSNRWNFKKYVKDTLSYGDNVARCHRVSYSVIEQILNMVFNAVKSGEMSDEEKNEVLEMIYQTFYPEEPEEESEEHQNYEELTECMGILGEVTGEKLQEDDSCKRIGAVLNRLLFCLNSCIRNLRLGNSSWNSSIGEYFDPVSWEVALLKGDKLCFVFNQDGVHAPVEVESIECEGIYLTDAVDGAFIYMLLNFGTYFVSNVTAFFQLQVGILQLSEPYEEITEMPYVGSSQNKFSLNARIKGKVAELPWFYQSPEGTYISVFD